MRHRGPRRPGGPGRPGRPLIGPPGRVRRGGGRRPSNPARPPVFPREMDAARGDLARAHESMRSGDYVTAQEMFVRVAALAAGHQLHRRAGHLYAQSARAALAAGNVAQAAAHADKALAAFVRSGDMPLTVDIINRLADHFEKKGHKDEADVLREKLTARLLEINVDPEMVQTRPVAEKPRELPAQCDACLGPVRPDEVQWLNETSASCAYCGNTLKAT